MFDFFDDNRIFLEDDLPFGKTRGTCGGIGESISDVMKRVDSLFGADEFKAVINDLVDVAKSAEGITSNEALFFRNYIFSIDEGCGVSTYSTLLADILSAAVGEEVLFFETVVKRKKFEYVSRSANDLIGVECIDISGIVGETHYPEFKKILKEIAKNKEKKVCIFKVPVLDEDVLQKLSEDISDVLYVETVRFPSLTFEIMDAYAYKEASSRGFLWSKELFEPFKCAILEEKADGRFYGYKTVGKVVQEIIFKKLINDSKRGQRDSIIRPSDIESILDRKSVLTSEEMLSKLSGMEKVKTQLREIVEQIENLHKFNIDKMPCIHMRFVGSPGTGKTSIARILGRMLAEKGVLKNGGFHEYTARELVVGYIGHTEEKVKEACINAYGSVLFVDEAYALYTSEDDDRDFGRQAINMFITEMENHRSDMVVIMAGYTDEMEHLMSANPGFKSRMPYEIVFDNYNQEELYSIFMTMADDRYEVEVGFSEAVKEFFASLPDSFINNKQFGNARYVRNLFERTQKYAINRCVKEKLEKPVFTCEDFLKASAEKGFAPDGDAFDSAAHIGF